MLIYLDDSLIPQLSSAHSLFTQTKDILEAIGLERYRGKNVLYLGKRLCSAISAELESKISVNALRAFRHSAARGYQKRQLLRELKWFIKLSGGQGVFDCENGEIGGMAVITVDQVQEVSIFGLGRLLAESLNDASYYCESSRLLIEEHPLLGGLRTANENLLGGGNTTDVQYDQIKMERRSFCFCVVDSDRSFEKASVGNTAARIKKSDESNPSPLAFSHIVDVYSVENLLTSSLIKEANRKDCSEDLWRNIEAVVEHIPNGYWKFIPLKSGIKSVDLRMNNGFGNYWRSQLNADGEICNTCASEAAICEQCYSIYPIPSKTLKNVVDIAKSDSRLFRSLMSDIDERIKGSLNDVAMKYLAAFCVGSPVTM